MPVGVSLTALELEFHKEEIERQLETLINWGPLC